MPPVLHRLGEIAYVLAEAGDPMACSVLDVIHIYTGGSPPVGLRAISGSSLQVFHMNDYPAEPPRDRITDACRVYPGDGVAPLEEILRSLRAIGFRGFLSLELFNDRYCASRLRRWPASGWQRWAGGWRGHGRLTENRKNKRAAHDSPPRPARRRQLRPLVISARAALTTALIWGAMPSLAALGAAESNPPRIYARLVDPREHPDYQCRAVRPPSWETFQNRTHLNGLRLISVEGDRIVHYAKDMEKYTKAYQLGDVVSAMYPILFAKNLGDLVDELRRRNLYLFGVCGYVPGMGPGMGIEQFKTPIEALKLLDAKLGPRWLSMDVGEQDGRYIGLYAPQMYPTSAGRVEQYFNFQRHFQRLTDDLGNKASALLTLTFGHHLLKEGAYTFVGAETAQGLPNDQVYYAFIRGAGKQYGVLSFNIASIYNRWGFKTYGGKGVDQFNYRYGPTEGTSLSLLKRLLYCGILHNCAIIGCESSFFEGEKLSPIGRLQQAAGKWLESNGQPGAMLAPIAVMTDFFAGWTFPRHLYTGDVYRVWGNLLYEPGDYLTDGVLDLLYPGYQNSSYYHDESGFLVPTPYGDAADCLLSDAPGWLLPRYSLLVVAGELSGGAEIRDKLAAYVRGGGRLVITAGNVAKMPGGLAGLRVAGKASRLAARRKVDLEPSAVVEDVGFELLPLEVPAGSRVLARCGPMPAAVEFSWGKGKITVLACPFGVGVDPANPRQDFQRDRPAAPQAFPVVETRGRPVGPGIAHAGHV